MATKKKVEVETAETVKPAKRKRTPSAANKFYNEMTLDYMKSYIEKNAPQDKEWFKSVAIDSKGKYQHLIAKRAFCEKYMPDKLPKRQAKVNKSESLLDW